MKPSVLATKGKATSLGLRIAQWECGRLMNWAMRHCDMFANSVCEIGPGKGHVCRWSKKKNLWYAAIDQTDVAKEMLTEMGADMVLVNRVPPGPEMLVDIYVMFAVLEHMDGPKEAKQVIESIFANLRPGGVVAILVPDIRFYGRFFWENSSEHNYPTSMGRVSRLLEECGFKVVQKEMLVSGVRLPLGYLIAIPARILKWLWILFRPCSDSGLVQKLSSHSPLAFIVGKKEQLLYNVE